jgi:hypothetical protein
MPKQTLVLVDADTVAGWRRPTPSLAQLESAVDDLRAQEPEAVVAVVGDPALKWALDDADRDLLEEQIRHGQIVLAPAGSQGGHVGFMAKAAARAFEVGLSPVAVTDRAVPDCPVARLRRDGTTWVFDLTNTTVPTADRAQPVVRRRRKKAASATS